MRSCALILLLLMIPLAAQGTCSEQLSLSVSARTSLHQLMKPGGGLVTARLFSGIIAGKKKLLVLLAETHLLTREAKASGDALLREFKLKGVEGVNLESIERHVLGAKLFHIFVLTPRAVLRWISGRRVQDSLSRSTPGEGQMEIPLEEGYMPGTPFKVAVWYINSLFVFALSTFATVACEMCGIQYPGQEEIAYLMNLWAVGIGLHGAVSLPPTVSVLMGEGKPRLWLTPLAGLVTDRDPNMVANAMKMFTRNPEHDSAVVVVGHGHVPGFITLLAERGFSETTLDRLGIEADTLTNNL